MRLVIMIIILFIASTCHAEKITFFAPEWKGYTNGDGTGYCWDVLRSIYEAEGIQMIHKIAPFKRSLRSVENKQADAAAGAFRTPERAKIFVYPKTRLDHEISGIVFLRGTPFDKIQNLKGQIGKVRGYDYSAWLPSSLNIYELNNTSQGIQMLRTKRIQYHADDIEDIESSIKRLGEKMDDFKIVNMHTQPLYVIFTKDNRGQRMADIYDRGNKRLYKTGKLDEIMNKYGLKTIPYDPKEFKD